MRRDANKEVNLPQQVQNLNAKLLSLQAQTDLAHKSKQKFECLWEAAPDANLLIDQFGQIHWVNSCAERLLGYPRNELLQFSVEALMPERFRVQHVKNRQDYFQFPHSRPMGLGREFLIQNRNGQEIPVEISLSPFQMGLERRVLCVLRDLTERNKALHLIEEQSRSLLALSTPAINLFEGIVLMPLIGVVDSQRAQHLMDNLLRAIAMHHAKVALIDIRGVPNIDSEVARHLLGAVSAAEYLGAKVILTGLRAASAKALVDLKIEMTCLMTLGSLQAGIQEAFRLIGKNLTNM